MCKNLLKYVKHLLSCFENVSLFPLLSYHFYLCFTVVQEKMEKEVILSISATKKQKRRARGTTSKVDSSVVDICDEGSLRTKMNDESAHSEATCIAGSFQSEKTVQINNCKNQEAGSERSCDAECSKLLALTTVAEEREKDASNIADINDIKVNFKTIIFCSVF